MRINSQYAGRSRLVRQRANSDQEVLLVADQVNQPDRRRAIAERKGLMRVGVGQDVASVRVERGVPAARTG
jgi:hypothetical protein